MRIVIVDDHPIFRDGLRRVLEDYGHEVVAACGDGRAGVETVRRLAPDLVLMDLQMPGTDGVTALGEMAGGPPVVVLTVSEEAGDMEAAMQAGASGYLLKSTDPAELVRLIDAAAHGYRIQPEPGALQTAGGPELSARQRSVLDGLTRGQTLKEIAQSLGISQFTVRTYQERLLEKFGVATRAELISAAAARPRD